MLVSGVTWIRHTFSTASLSWSLLVMMLIIITTPPPGSDTPSPPPHSAGHCWS